MNKKPFWIQFFRATIWLLVLTSSIASVGLPITCAILGMGFAFLGESALQAAEMDENLSTLIIEIIYGKKQQ